MPKQRVVRAKEEKLKEYDKEAFMFVHVSSVEKGVTQQGRAPKIPMRMLPVLPVNQSLLASRIEESQSGF